MVFNPGSATYRQITVDFITSSYRVVGKVLVTHSGMLGLMTDTNSSVVEVHDAQLARLHMANRLANRFEIVRLVKNQIAAVCLNRRDDLGPMGYGHNPGNSYPLHIVTANYEINGSLDWTGQFDISAIMAKGTRDFIVLENANISAILIPTLHIESRVLLVNRNSIEIVALAVQENMEEEL